MGRKLMRVPLDFGAPINEIWKGYLHSEAPKEIQDAFPVSGCDDCKKKGLECDESAVYCIVCNPDWTKLWYYEPPKGEGYQLWEDTTEGSPQSPVFKTLEELAEWCEKNATTFADFTATKEEWLEMLGGKGYAYAQQGNIIFV